MSGSVVKGLVYVDKSPRRVLKTRPAEKRNSYTCLPHSRYGTKSQLGSSSLVLTYGFRNSLSLPPPCGSICLEYQHEGGRDSQITNSSLVWTP